MYYSIGLTLLDGTDLSSYGATVRDASIYTSMDSLFPQLEFLCIVNEIDLLGRGVLRFGTELNCSVFDNNGRQLTKLFFCIYNIELVGQTAKHSTTGTLRISCVGRWYFRQMATSSIYPGTPSDALLSVLTAEANLDYTEFLIQQSKTIMKTVWYRCNMTAAKFIKTILEPNYLIDESPAYLFANDLGQILSDSYITISGRPASALVIEPSILAVVTGLEDDLSRALGYSDLRINLGSEFAWQTQAQRLTYLSESYTVVSGGVEPSSYLSPLGFFPPKLYQTDKNYYSSPYTPTQVVLDDSSNTAVNIRAKFLNSYRKKGIESFQIGIAMDTDYRLTVGSVFNFRLTSLPQGNPEELQEHIAAEKIKFPAGLDDSILSGKYFIKNMKRNFIQQPTGQYASITEITVIKCQ